MLAEADDGAWIRWEEEGTGEPLVLVMGLGGAGSAWSRLVPLLARDLRVIWLDNRGTGRSDRIGATGTRMGGLVADVVAVLDAAGIGAAHVMGTSLGGMVAQALALERPERVASLVLAATTPAGLAGGPPWPLLGAGALRPLLGPTRVAAVVQRALYAPQTALLDVDADLAVAREEPTPTWTALTQLLVGAAHDARPRLEELAGVPTTVVHGTADRIFATARARELAEGIPGARLELVAGAGHVLATDAGERVAAIVRAHVARATAPGP